MPNEVGRPCTLPAGRRTELNLSVELLALLDEIAEIEGVPRAVVIREALWRGVAVKINVARRSVGVA